MSERTAEAARRRAEREQRDRKARELAGLGLSLEAIARRLETSRATISRALGRTRAR
jgi:transposase